MPNIDETTEFICLSDKPFEDRKYAYTGALGVKPKNGMWFSLPSKSDGMISEWHEFLCDKSPNLISKFCNEDGTTNVISAKLKDTIIVTASELVDALSEAKKNIHFNSEIDEKRKSLLEAVKTKFNISDAKHLILNLDEGGLEAVFNLFNSSDFWDPRSLINSVIPKKIQEEGLFYYYSPYSTLTGKMQLTEYQKTAKLITKCLCNSDSLEESELNFNTIRALSSILVSSMGIKIGRDFSRLHPDHTCLPYINFKKYSSKECILQILEHVDAPQEEKEELLSEYDRGTNSQTIFESQTFWSLMKDELLKDYADFLDNVRENNVFLPDLGAIEIFWFKKHPYTVKGSEFFNILVEQEKSHEQHRMQNLITSLPKNITTFFSGMINRSYVEYGLDIPSLVVFDTNCLNVVEQKRQSLFSREQIIDGITQNVNALVSMDKENEVANNRIDI